VVAVAVAQMAVAAERVDLELYLRLHYRLIVTQSLLVQVEQVVLVADQRL
jgi:hypothetical protein